MDLATVTKEVFEPHLRTRFRIVGEHGAIEAELVEVLALKPMRPDGRPPFSMLFRGPREPLLAQRIYRVEHDVLGELELFFVPIAQGEVGTTYETILS